MTKILESYYETNKDLYKVFLNLFNGTIILQKKIQHLKILVFQVLVNVMKVGAQLG